MCIYIIGYVYMCVYFVSAARLIASRFRRRGGGLAPLFLLCCLICDPVNRRCSCLYCCGRSQVVSEAGALSFAKPEPFLRFPYLLLFEVLFALLRHL